MEEHKQRHLLYLEKASWKKQCTGRDLRAKEDMSKKIGKKGLARRNNVYKQRGVGNRHKDVEGDEGVKRIDNGGPCKLSEEFGVYLECSMHIKLFSNFSLSLTHTVHFLGDNLA